MRCFTGKYACSFYMLVSVRMVGYTAWEYVWCPKLGKEFFPRKERDIWIQEPPVDKKKLLKKKPWNHV